MCLANQARQTRHAATARALTPFHSRRRGFLTGVGGLWFLCTGGFRRLLSRRCLANPGSLRPVCRWLRPIWCGRHMLLQSIRAWMGMAERGTPLASALASMLTAAAALAAFCALRTLEIGARWRWHRSSIVWMLPVGPGFRTVLIINFSLARSDSRRRSLITAIFQFLKIVVCGARS